MALFSSATTFLSRGLSRGDKAGTRRVSALLRLTTIGVALSLSVMLLSVTIILGFHRQIHEFAFSQTGHISLNGYGSNWKTSTTPVYVSPELLSFLRGEKGVSSVSPLIQQAGLLKTEGDFSGILLYGIDSTFRSRYFTEQVKSGTLPSFSESEYSRPPIVLPSHVARRMNYKVGDAVRIYFFGEKMRVRVFELQAIYESTGLELSPALCPISSLQRLNHWDENTYSRLIIMLQDPDAAYPTLVKAILPPWMYGIFGAIIFGAILSTYVAALNSAATLFSLDFYKGIFRKNASEQSVVRMGKITNVVIALVSIGLAPLLINAPTGLYNFLQEYVGFYNIPLIVIILFGFFNKNVSAVGAKVCFTFHIVVYVIAKFLFGDLNFLYIHSVLFFLDILVMWGSTKFAPLAGGYSFTPNANKVDLTPWKYRKYVAVVVVLGIFTVYAIFSPLGIGR